MLTKVLLLFWIEFLAGPFHEVAVNKRISFGFQFFLKFLGCRRYSRVHHGEHRIVASFNPAMQYGWKDLKIALRILRRWKKLWHEHGGVAAIARLHLRYDLVALPHAASSCHLVVLDQGLCNVRLLRNPLATRPLEFLLAVPVHFIKFLQPLFYLTREFRIPTIGHNGSTDQADQNDKDTDHDHDMSLDPLEYRIATHAYTSSSTARHTAAEGESLLPNSTSKMTGSVYIVVSAGYRVPG